MFITDKAKNKTDDRFFYIFDDRRGTFSFYMCTSVASADKVWAKKCLVSKAGPFGGPASKDLDWGKVGVFRFEGEFEEEEVFFYKKDISGKAVFVFGNLLTVPEPIRQET